MKTALHACAGGVWLAVRAPALFLVASVITIVAVVPFALVLGDRLRTALGNQPPINLDAEEIDAEWWMEFRAQARGLEATFTPTIIGFAAPLDNLSALADGTPRPLALVAPVALYGLVWAFLWGGILPRFDRGHASGPRAFLRDARRHLPRFALIAAAAAMASLILYWTVHRVLFGPVYEWLVAPTTNERDAFLWRVALYLVFGAMLALVSLAADYARISCATGRAAGAGQALGAGAAFMRGHARAVMAAFVLTGLLFVGLLIVYGVVDRRFGGWRGVIVGQAYIMARLAIRLTNAASEVRLYQILTGFRGQASSDFVNPGPPAAT